MNFFNKKEQHTNGQKSTSKLNLVMFLSIFAATGCKESQFYSLPFGEAVASMY